MSIARRIEALGDRRPFSYLEIKLNAMSAFMDYWRSMQMPGGPVAEANPLPATDSEGEE